MAYEASIDDEGMGIADTEESNTNANEYIDGIHVTVEYPAKDAVAEHHAPTSHNRASLTMEGDESREGGDMYPQLTGAIEAAGGKGKPADPAAEPQPPRSRPCEESGRNER
ncbi:unnamed protein product [Miscanthus lutarioriparius]|uniref:Uncharacterized protein n=1 Tax=Miscanthus lutarioriparius TaxID=422564 RepID=A0A811PSX5_9POAL|nr:unnamed protein product [Miscanthus lutarioriparius]